eukprot:1411933-Pleurochrysis_carterae.AAC.1
MENSSQQVIASMASRCAGRSLCTLRTACRGRALAAAWSPSSRSMDKRASNRVRQIEWPWPSQRRPLDADALRPLQRWPALAPAHKRLEPRRVALDGQRQKLRALAL